MALLAKLSVLLATAIVLSLLRVDVADAQTHGNLQRRKSKDTFSSANGENQTALRYELRILLNTCLISTYYFRILTRKQRL